MGRRASKGDKAFLVECAVLAKRWDGSDPEAFGLTEADVDAFIDMVGSAAARAREAAEAANLAAARFDAKQEAIASLRARFGALTGAVDVKAKRVGPGKARGVYSAAGIDPPRKGGPLPTPEKPEGFDHTLTRGGSLIVTFAIDDGARGGLLYEVQRQTADLDGAAGEWIPLDIVGVKRFEDGDVPKGVSQVLYRVRAMRTTGLKGEWSYPVTIPFGTMKSEATSAADEDADGPDAVVEVGAERSMEAKPLSEDSNRERETAGANGAG